MASPFIKDLLDCDLQPDTTLWTPLGQCKRTITLALLKPAASLVRLATPNPVYLVSQLSAIHQRPTSNARQRASATACAVVGVTDRLPGDGFLLRVTLLPKAARAGQRRRSAKVRGRSKRLTNVGFSNQISVIKAASALTRVLPPASLHAQTDRRQLFFCGGRDRAIGEWLATMRTRNGLVG